ncbi:hypothetical protein [Paenibacillus odorifer]|uniref:hypothetical protein n=1 Tax=Paenibacillus odorifer TaxID=189426 RepID=UPI00111579C5|nr:hypothetical protein [Paenibacillus odorifer]
MSKKRILRYGGFASLYLWSSVTSSSCYTFRSLSSQDFAAADRTSAAAGRTSAAAGRTSAAAGGTHLSLFAPVI